MISKEDAAGISSHLVNWFGAAANALLIAIGGLSVNEWGVVAGIIFGFLTFVVNLWYKRRLVRVAEENGRVSL